MQCLRGLSALIKTRGVLVNVTMSWPARTPAGEAVGGPHALSRAVDLVMAEVGRHTMVARLRAAEVVADDVMAERSR